MPILWEREMRQYENRFRKNRHERLYTLPSQLRTADTNGNGACIVNQGEDLLGNDGFPQPPIICCHADTGVGGVGPVITQGWETVGTGLLDPTGWVTDLGQAYWGLPSYYRASFAPMSTIFLQAEKWQAGLHVGKALNEDGSMQNVNHVGIYFDSFLDKWVLTVNNKTGPVGHRLFTRQLNSGAGGSQSVAVNILTEVAIEYAPGAYIEVRLSGGTEPGLLFRDTDADVAPYTPLADMKANAAASQATRYGIGIFSRVTDDLEQRTVTVPFWWLYANTDTASLGDSRHS